MENKTQNKPLRILFVDDEANILSALKRLMVDEPYEIFTAQSGKEALALLERDRSIAVIVSDQRMPEMNGAEFLEKAKAIVPEAGRIVLTGYADMQAAVDAINKGGAQRYIAKPWNDNELITLIRDTASRYALVQENKRLTEIVHRQNAELKQWSSQLEYDVQKQSVEISRKNDALKIANERLNKNFKDSIEAFAGLIELRDRNSMSHSRNVAEVAVEAGKSAGMKPEEMEFLKTAALLHDIGKIGMPDILLVKSFETMTADEQKEYLLHPIRGQSAIDSVEYLRPAGLLIRSHHEAFNGTGFPDRLKGDEIPLGARIIAAVDFFDRTFALHQGKNPFDLSWYELKKEDGKKFDPEVYGWIEKPLRDFYAHKVAKAGMVEIELSVSDISVGLQLAQDLRSGTGLLLLTKGTILNPQNVEALRRFYQVDPPSGGVYVWSKR